MIPSRGEFLAVESFTNSVKSGRKLSHESPFCSLAASPIHQSQCIRFSDTQLRNTNNSNKSFGSANARTPSDAENQYNLKEITTFEVKRTVLLLLCHIDFTELTDSVEQA